MVAPRDQGLGVGGIEAQDSIRGSSPRITLVGPHEEAAKKSWHLVFGYSEPIATGAPSTVMQLHEVFDFDFDVDFDVDFAHSVSLSVRLEDRR
jgi:hypothetical protein